MKRVLLSFLAIVLGLGMVFGSYVPVQACHAGNVNVVVGDCVVGGRQVTISGLFNAGAGYRGTVKVGNDVLYGPVEYTGADANHNYSLSVVYPAGNYQAKAILERKVNGNWVVYDTQTKPFTVTPCPTATSTKTNTPTSTNTATATNTVVPSNTPTVVTLTFTPTNTATPSNKQITAKALCDHEISGTEWHFVINQISEESKAPLSIEVTWEGGISQIVPLQKFTGGVAHYSTTSNLDRNVTSAKAFIYDGWGGQFNLSHGPSCDRSTPTTPPTSTSTRTNTPTNTPTATPTQVEVTLTATMTPTGEVTFTATPTKTNTPLPTLTYTATATFTVVPSATATATKTTVPTQTNTPWVVTATFTYTPTASGTAVVVTSTNTPVPPKTGAGDSDFAYPGLRLPGFGLIGLGLLILVSMMFGKRR